MREIKFRAWLKDKKEMVGITTIDFKNGCVLIDKPYFPKILEYYGTTLLFDQIELMQYTGLKDKNGVDIFEGDIVRIYLDDENNKTEILICIYNNKLTSFKFKDIDGGLWGVCDTCLEVIGNIYENKELLGEY